MMRWVALGCAIVLGSAAPALANGRAPATSTINFKQGNDQEIIAGLTFGALISHDGGATWYWMCEAAIGYGGIYDPVYALTPTGAVFATTFDGLVVARDGCAFNPTPPPEHDKFVSSAALGPDHALYAATTSPPNTATGDPGDSKIYKSADDGLTFPTSASPGQIGDFWQTIAVARSDAQRVYLTGYRPGTTTFLLFSSQNAGVSFEPMVQTGLVTGPFSVIELAGISPTNPDVVFVRVKYAVNNVGDAFYRSTTGGTTGSWTQILAEPVEAAFVVRGNGDLVAGTLANGSFVSHDDGANWVPLVGPPHINCLSENAAGELWACTANYGPDGDDACIMRSTDLASWTKVLRYQDILAPVECAGGTAQHDACAPLWCSLEQMFGITSTVIDCPLAVDAPGPPPVTKAGCCQSSDASPAGALGLGLLLGVLVLRRRRR